MTALPHAGAPAPQPDAAGLENPVETIGQLADQAAVNGHYGLQDVCLLMAEALDVLPPDGWTQELATVVNNFASLFNAYAEGFEQAIPDIITILRHPSLASALTDEEYTLLASQLAADIGAPAAQVDAGFQDNDVNAEFLDSLSPVLSKVVLELVELLVMEAALIEQLLDAITLGEPEATADSLERLTDELERYVNASHMAGFEGLALICEQVNANVQLFRADSAAFGAEQLALLRDWIAHVKDYLAQFHDADAGLPLIAHLGAMDWPAPLALDTAAVIVARLQAPGSTMDELEQAPRKLAVTPDDVSLALPDDVNPELLDILLQELPEQTQAFAAVIQRLQAGGDLADLDVAQRIAHTVKGAANTVGIKGIAELTHRLEDILMACAQARKLPGQALLNVLVDAADCLDGMTEAVTDLAAPPDDALRVLQTVLDWANRIVEVGVEHIEDAPIATLPVGELAAAEVADGPPPAAEAAAEPAQAAMVRVAAEQMDALFRLAGEQLVLGTQASERARRLKNQLQAMETQLALLRQLGDELEQLIDLKDLSGRTRITETGLDALEMDQYNELHTASRRLVEAAFDIRELTRDAGKDLGRMTQLLEDQQRLANEAQETLLQTRLAPVSSIVHRLQRGVRQTCRLTGKHCDLTVAGEQLMVDGDTLNLLVEPLMHVLRNAVDHGIESEQARLAAVKPPRGAIVVEFDRDGDHIQVRVSDDGAGLDYAAIRAAAERRGAIQPGQTVTEDDLKRYILRPNFSTRTHATQTSGRGVGMDAVHFQVQAQGGSLALQSAAGQGLTVELKIPLPLSRAHALLTQVGPYRVAIASRGIGQVLFAGTGDITSVDGQPRLRLDGASYPVVTLEQLLHVRGYREHNHGHRTALLVRDGERVTAVLLEAITGGHDIVIKNLGYYFKKLPGFIGAAIIGDGSAVPVLDLPELLRTATDADAYGAYGDYADDAPIAPALPTVLVVDDSLSQRRALEQLLQDAGFQVSSARDGVEAAEQLAGFRPDMVLTDLEMPRMNGIELTAHIRARDHLKALPVIMITSRTTQTHRKLAEDAGVDFYLVKPVREDDLLTKIQNLIDLAAPCPV